MITIYGELYSKKNSKSIYKNKKTNKFFIASNKKVEENEDDIIYQLKKPLNKTKWNEMRNAILLEKDRYPIKVELFFYRKTNRAFDYINIAQIVFDAMVKAEYIPDDSMNYVIPVFKGWAKDSENPRAEIVVYEV